MTKVRVSCWTRTGGNIHLDIPANKLNSLEYKDLVKLVIEEVQDKYNTRIHPLNVQVIDDKTEY